MQQKKLNNILYVFDITPYVITQDTDADIIKVQQECYEGYVELNPDLASKIVKYNYHMFTVTQQEWAPYVDADDKPSPELAWSAASATVTIGADDNVFPTLSNPHDIVTISYESSNDTVAEINSYGVITLVAEGNTTISAIFEGDDDYAAQTVTYALTVQQAQPQPLPSPELAWSAESATVTIGADDNVFPTLSNPYNVDINYFGGNDAIASIDSSTGVITLIGEGTVWITAEHIEGGDEYAYGRADYLLTVQQAQPQPLPSPELAWSEDSATVIIGESNSFPSLINPHSVTVSYESSDTTKATIDPSTGVITLLDAGETVIAAIFNGDDTYSAANAYYTLTVQQDQPQTITVTAPYGLVIFDETTGQAVTMTPVGESEPTEATGTLVVGHTCQIDQSSGVGRAQWPIFTPSCSQGTYGAIGELFTAPATDLTITFTSNQLPNIAWSNVSATVTLNDPNNVFPTVNSNPNNYTIVYGAWDHFDYSTPATEATIDSSTGAITLITDGMCYITAGVVSYLGNQSRKTYTLNVLPEANTGVTVTYNVNNTSQAVALWADDGDNYPDRMYVDGVYRTVADTYQFSTTGSHTVQYMFDDQVLDINFYLTDQTTPIEITGFQVGSDIEEVIGNAWTVKQFDAGESDEVDVEQTYLPTTPPTIIGIGESSDRPGATIYVPSDSVSAYQNASVWSDISALIQAIPVQ